MNIVIPLGGKGLRFQKVGYTNPKCLINVFLKPIVKWCIDHLCLSDDDHIYIPYNHELINYNFEYLINTWYPKLNITCILLDTQTKGAAETLYLTSKYIDNLNQVISLDCDVFFTCDILQSISKNVNSITVFYDNIEYTNTPYSYINKDNNNKIFEIIEKKKISDYAVAGVYSFRNRTVILDYFDDFKKNHINELYTSTFINFLINKYEIDFFCNIIDYTSFHNLGTPLDVQLFCNSLPLNPLTDNNIKTDFKSQRICFDLDDTLVTKPEKDSNYSTVKPIQHNIDVLNYLKRIGHTIIINTARRMKTHNGNVGRVITDVGQITLKTLSDFNINYDELYFGKPFADYYIDDKAINANCNLENALGIFLSTDARYFNECSIENMQIFVKKSYNKAIIGEIYFYENIPKSIKDMFPIFLKNEKFQEEYTYMCEYVNGTNISNIYTNCDNFEYVSEILKSLFRIHVSELHIDISKSVILEELYINKLEERYNKLNYDEINTRSNELYIYLKKYFENINIDIICPVVMHGDPVFTNILINKFQKFKFIDMRGKIGSNLTIFGDAYYDLGKIYQSIIGYDYVLKNVQSNQSKIRIIKKEFMYICDKHNFDTKHLQHVTLYLLFTLIPLHSGIKKQKKLFQLCIDLYDELINE